MEIRRLRNYEVRGKAEKEYVDKVTVFLREVVWTKTNAYEGGTTRLEMYFLYFMRTADKRREREGGKISISLTQKSVSLESRIARFNAAINKIKELAVKEEQECLLQPANAPKSRLEELAVHNKHSAIISMPVVTDEEAKTITRAIIPLRGRLTPGQRRMLDDGRLELVRRPIRYRSSIGMWMKTLTEEIQERRGTRMQPEDCFGSKPYSACPTSHQADCACALRGTCA